MSNNMITIEEARAVFQSQKENLDLTKSDFEAGLKIMKNYPYNKYVAWDQPVKLIAPPDPAPLIPPPGLAIYPTVENFTMGIIRRHPFCLPAIAKPGYLYIIFKEEVLPDRFVIKQGWVPIAQVQTYD
jgi:hypothetical protein